MSMRINHNISALNSWRNLNNTNMEMGKTLEKLSSGYKINRAADGPATLVISEQMRAQIKSLEQAVSNSEVAVSMIQTTEAALNEVNTILTSLRQLSIHAANEGANDEKMLAADQLEIENSLSTINRIARQAQFGTRYLLDGSNGTAGFTVGDGIRFITSGEKAKGSPAEGYEVDIKATATRSRMEGARAMTQQEIEAGGIDFNLSEGGKNITYTTEKGDSMRVVMTQLRRLSEMNGLELDVELTESNRIAVTHKEYGSGNQFSAAVSADGLLSSKANFIEESVDGTDIVGTIGGELAVGEGQFLTAAAGTRADGTTIQFTGDVKKAPADQFVDENGEPIVHYDEQGNVIDAPEVGVPEGSVHIANNALKFQVGPNGGQTVSISLPNTNANEMSKGVANMSGFRSIADIDVTTFQGAQDALLLIDEAIDQISSTRADLGAFQKNTLESNLSNLRYSTENLVAAESSIRDTDMAAEMATFTKNQILLSSGTAMLSQANQVPKSVLTLLNQ